MRLGEVTTAVVAALEPAPLLAIPVGSCEQHGPHLPLATDAIIAEALADHLAATVEGVVIGPTVTVTASGEHAGFAGTLSIGTPATTTTIVELARSADWARGIVLVNGHGGNRDAVDAAVAKILAEGRRVVAWWPEVPGGDAHAGRTETSLLLTIRPDLVDDERMAPGATAALADLMPTLRTGGVRAVSPSGVLGDPRAATLEEGTHLIHSLAADLVAVTRRYDAPNERHSATRESDPPANL